ncbi:hypothetical protein [Phascolarctobacterium faecium]|uniref:hypothetical protein n=1 Tax=Phascolarctobacterium faecium TaxID=33025 RepID=UPI003FD74F48
MRLIDADVLKTKILECSKKAYSYGTFVEYYKGKVVAYENAVDLIDGAPIIEERKHGYWIEHPEHPIGDCSICGERVPIYSGSKKYKICPYCGAIMDGKEKNDKSRANKGNTDFTR